MTPLVEFRNIVKTFGGVHAVENVSLDLGEGEVLGLLGHNGAGKSTLIKILSGVFTADSGEIRFAGRPVAIRSTRDAKSLGIETIYQTLALSENLDAVANLFLGRELAGWFGFMDEEAMEEETQTTLQRLRLRLPHLSNLVASLSGGQRQAVAIARAIHFNAKVLIMDEPTAALGPEETQKVGALISELSRQGIGIILISHDINDVFDLASRLAVMKNGRLVGTVRTADVIQGRSARHDHRGQTAATKSRLTVDAHVHLWRLSRGDNVALSPAMTAIYKDREPADLKPLIDAAGVGRVVVVQAAETLAETLFTIGLGRESCAGLPASWRGSSWLRRRSKRKLPRSPGTQSSKACARCETTTGASPGCSTAGWNGAFRRCRTTASRSMFWCKTGGKFRWRLLLAKRWPGLSIVLDHCGKPDIANRVFDPWARHVDELASLPNVVCKLSGLLNCARSRSGRRGSGSLRRGMFWTPSVPAA